MTVALESQIYCYPVEFLECVSDSFFFFIVDVSGTMNLNV